MNVEDVWRNLSGRIGFYTKQTFREIPQSPGVYAWFLPLWIYDEDLERLVSQIQEMSMHDSGEPSFNGVPIRQTRMDYCWDTLNVTIQKEAKYKPSIEKLDMWQHMLSNPDLHAAFTQSLMQASIFTQPLYVGKANNLRSRYDQHTSDGQLEANLFSNRFSQYCQEKGLALRVSDLLYACIPIPILQNEVLEDSRLNELLEHVLMRIARPPFSIR